MKEILEVLFSPSYYDFTCRHKMTLRRRNKAIRQYSYNFGSLLPEDKRSRILDLGCSDGIALEWITDHGFRNVAGVDTDHEALGRARERLSGKLPESAFILRDLLDFLHSESSEDAHRVFMFNVVEHLEKESLLDVIREISRVLKPGGLFLAQTGNIENPFNFGLFARDFTHRIAFTPSSLKQVMLMAGFRPGSVEVRPLRYRTSLTNWPLQITGPIMGYLVKVLAYSMRIRIDEMAPMIYCVCRKDR